MSHRRTAAAAGVLLLLASACGSSDDGEVEADGDTPSSDAATPDVVYDESEVVEHLELDADPTIDELWFYRADGVDCEISDVLTSAADVETQGEGNATAVSPDGAAGVVIVGPERVTCSDVITDALADFG